jgi:hypothetical protein
MLSMIVLMDVAPSPCKEEGFSQASFIQLDRVLRAIVFSGDYVDDIRRA